ncbi:sugar transferase [Hymenobacter sp. BT188]|uniref:sugar transferase n=1 Tax=Hymenobacter sp. BT188 TaxID=2763504 RepID=UPI001650FB2E|nr:sugar transferase [Hymenobacter sp. BT188]MBC6608744.1 sugar transferase [Hymenobacter sp. BT188]
MLHLFTSSPPRAAKVHSSDPKPYVLVNVSSRLKRPFDVVVALVAIVLVLSWLGPLLALLIRLESRGPILFRQLRTGYNGQPFYCLKFRSMRPNSEADLKQACQDDSRVTRVGAFMRRNNLDELPQFINVLWGEMSVVGPRPHMLLHTEVYAQAIDNFMLRHCVSPGITGWAQVNGYRGATRELVAMQRRVHADLWYLQNWSLALDIRIICRTLGLWLTRQPNAY